MLMDTLKSDSKAMEIFLDEIAKVDLIANRKERFLNYGQPFSSPSKLMQTVEDEQKYKEQAFGRPIDVGKKIRKFGVAPSDGYAQYTMYGTSYQKGTFATKFNQREYFENYIRPNNKALFGLR